MQQSGLMMSTSEPKKNMNATKTKTNTTTTTTTNTNPLGNPSKSTATRLAMILSVLPVNLPCLTGETLQGDVFTIDTPDVKVRLALLPTDVYVETTYERKLTVSGSLPDREAARHLLNLFGN